MFFVKFSDYFQNKENSLATWSEAVKVCHYYWQVHSITSLLFLFFLLSDIFSHFQTGADAISELGGAKEGQKTLLDALYPLCRAFNTFASEDASPVDLNRLIPLLFNAAEEGIEWENINIVLSW
jgi:hypothetical protein